jgi:hypothetical protein
MAMAGGLNLMPETVVTGPDGREYTVIHPPGASQSEIIAYAKKNSASLPAAKPKGVVDSIVGGVKQGNRPIQETLDTIGSGVAGSLAGLARGLYGSVTGEDYETATAAQDKLASDLTVAPRSEAGEAVVGKIGDLADNKLFNWMGELSESWGQGTNDYLEETPLAPVAPLAGILASLGPDVAAGAATAGTGKVALATGKAAVNGGKRVLDNRKPIAPTLLSEINSTPKTPDKSAGAAEVERARQNVATAQDLETPITLTQGQATRNAAQMTDEYNLPRQNPKIGDPLARLQAQQQMDLHENLAKQESPRANWMHLNTDEDLGRGVKGFLADREKANKKKTDDLYAEAREQGAMDVPIRVDGLDDAFDKLEAGFYNKVQSGEFNMLRDMADEIGVSGGRLATINDVEKFRVQINRVLKDPLNPNHKAMATILKEAVDESLNNVPKSAAAYKRARAAYARNKTETDGNALVTQITGKKGRTQSPATADEKVYTKIKNAPIEDVKRMLRMMAKVPDGVNMIHTLGQRVMMDLVETSQKAGGEFNAQAFKRELNKLDRSGKLEALYGPRKAQQLRDIAEVAETVNTLPYGNTANISQSGNTILKGVTEIIGKVPFMPLVTRPIRATGDLYQGRADSDFLKKKVDKSLDIEGLLSYE